MDGITALAVEPGESRKPFGWNDSPSALRIDLTRDASTSTPVHSQSFRANGATNIIEQRAAGLVGTAPWPFELLSLPRPQPSRRLRSSWDRRDGSASSSGYISTRADNIGVLNPPAGQHLCQTNRAGRLDARSPPRSGGRGHFNAGLRGGGAESGVIGHEDGQLSLYRKRTGQVHCVKAP